MKFTTKAIAAELDAFKEATSKAAVPEAIQIDPEIEKLAKDIGQDPMLYKKRIDAINRSRVVGERKNIAMYFATLESRLLPDNPVNPNALATKNSGHFGSGKSFTLMSCLKIYPESSYVLITNGSPKSLYYIKGGLKHKALIVTEGFQFQKSNAVDSELVYIVRSLISEGRIRYAAPEKNAEDKFETVFKESERSYLVYYHDHYGKTGGATRRPFVYYPSR